MESLPLLSPTKVHIVRQLIARGRTASQIASVLDIQVSAARKHLERLCDLGLVTERFERALRGRPKKIYELTESGRELLPRRYDAILNAVLGTLRAEYGSEKAEEFMNRVARGIADGARPSSRGGAKAEATLSLLDALGFEPALQRRRDGYEVTSGNCPILRAARAHGELVCRGIHEEILRAMLGGPIRRGMWIVNGDPVCTHLISAPGPRET